MQIDYKKMHNETEKKFYQRMNKQKTLFLTIIIVSLGSFFLYVQYWSIDHSDSIDIIIWTMIVGILFVFQTFTGYFIFEHERKKYMGK